jgi:hypothetical protein
MPADESSQQRTIETYLRRMLGAGTLTVDAISAYSVNAFAAVQDGTTAIEVTFEGGATRAVVNCPPHIVLAACETILSEQDPENPLAGTSLTQRYADFSGGRIGT